MLIFEWDKNKAKKNKKKHGINFDEATTAFADPLSMTIEDQLHSEEENRFILLGTSYNHKILVVIHTERNNSIRIISARKANKQERSFYENNK